LPAPSLLVVAAWLSGSCWSDRSTTHDSKTPAVRSGEEE
jgi:hypothetical protein